MLSEEQLKLVTAYVDGELSQRQRKDAMRLLHQSSEARELLLQLQENLHRVKSLPRRKLPTSVADDVLIAIRDSKAPRRVAPRRRYWAPYLAAAVAASIVLIPLGAFYYYHAQPDQLIVEKQKPRPEAFVAIPEKNVTPSKKLPNPMIAQMIEGSYRDFAAPILADRSHQPVSVAFRDLRNEGRATGILTRELASDKAVQLEITVKDNPTSLERLRRAFSEAGIQLVVESSTDNAMKQPAAKTDYWVYAENLNPDEATKIFRELSQDDASLKTFSKSPFEKMTISSLTGTEKQKVASQLGIDPSKLERVSAPKQDFKRWDRTAVVLSTTKSTPSDELKRFVSQRPAMQSGTVQILVKVRHD